MMKRLLTSMPMTRVHHLLHQKKTWPCVCLTITIKKASIRLRLPCGRTVVSTQAVPSTSPSASSSSARHLLDIQILPISWMSFSQPCMDLDQTPNPGPCAFMLYRCLTMTSTVFSAMISTFFSVGPRLRCHAENYATPLLLEVSFVRLTLHAHRLSAPTHAAVSARSTVTTLSASI